MHSFNAILAFAALALVALSPGSAQANALAANRAQVARHVHAHNLVAKRKRSDSSGSGRCQQRFPSSPSPSPTPTPTPTPPPPTTTSSPPASTPTPDSTKKMCLAWANGDTGLDKFATMSRVGYLYDWHPELPSSLSLYPSIKGMPMLHDAKQIGEFQQIVVPGYAYIALGMNEPNEPSTYMRPQDAVDIWRKYMEPLVQEGYNIVTPACTDDDAGWDWYQEFMYLCTGCHFGAMAFHAYTSSSQHLIDYATRLHDTYGLDIMITEYACTNFVSGPQPTMDEIWDYAGKVLAFVQNTAWLTAACPFGALPAAGLQGVAPGNLLMDENGNPTPLAYYYLDG